MLVDSSVCCRVFLEIRIRKYLGNFYRELLGNKSKFNGMSVDD